MPHPNGPRNSRPPTWVGVLARAGVVAALVLPPVANAQTTVVLPVSGELKAALEAIADVERGKVAYEDCQGCHRKDGSGRVSGAIPRLSGQHASVLIKQLLDIRSGLRINLPMKPHVEGPDMTPQVFADIAAYLQALPVNGQPGQGPGTALPQGKALYAQHCAACHGAQGQGQAGLLIPMLAAQHQGYLLREMGLIRDGGRGNSNAAMVQVVRGLAPADLAALADHLSRLPAPSRP